MSDLFDLYIYMKINQKFIDLEKIVKKENLGVVNDTLIPKNLEISWWDGSINPNQIYTEELEIELEYCRLYLTLKDEHELFKKLHPNRLNLNYFLFFKLSRLSKDIICCHFKKEEICSNIIDNEDIDDCLHRTPIEHGEEKYDFCWGNFVSNCLDCGYEVYKNNKIECLACYYFEHVLNELHSTFVLKSE